MRKFCFFGNIKNKFLPKNIIDFVERMRIVIFVLIFAKVVLLLSLGRIGFVSYALAVPAASLYLIVAAMIEVIVRSNQKSRL